MANTQEVLEGTIYGQAPKEPSPIPDIQGIFDAAGIPKGKLGELPHSKEWYAGAKKRAKLREEEVEILYEKKGSLRRDWVNFVTAGLAVWDDRIHAMQKMRGPTGGLAEQLARAAHERPFDEERIAILNDKSDTAAANLERLTAELASVKASINESQVEILKKEALDAAQDETRNEEKLLAKEKKERADKELARQAALLRGEELDEDNANGAENQPDANLLLSDIPKSPSPELRGGLGRQLPPLMGAMSPASSPSRTRTPNND